MHGVFRSCFTLLFFEDARGKPFVCAKPFLSAKHSMKRKIFLVASLCSMVVLTGCKSREKAYRQAFELAQENEQTTTTPTTPVAVVTTPTEVKETPVQPVTPVQPSTMDNVEVRTIDAGFTVLPGYNPLKAYSVQVGSFVTQANAERAAATLKQEGYDARVLQTNEVIKGRTGWFRVIASSFDDKASAVSSRESLRSRYPDAWILYRK